MTWIPIVLAVLAAYATGQLRASRRVRKRALFELAELSAMYRSVQRANSAALCCRGRALALLAKDMGVQRSDLPVHARGDWDTLAAGGRLRAGRLSLLFHEVANAAVRPRA